LVLRLREIKKDNIVPEELPAEEDIKRLEKKVKKEEKRLANNSKKNK
jgi:hypothetical protein